MDSLDFWRLCDELSIQQAALLIAGRDPSEDHYVEEQDVHTRYFLTSLSYQQIDEFMKAARRHWEVEINLHWSLDVSFADDLNRICLQFSHDSKVSCLGL